jgi:drug/metabolite transporter (DMT)-like permease
MAALAPPGRSSRPLLGVLFMCAACALFPIMNGFVKLLAATYDPLQIVWFRIVIHLVLVAMVFMPRMGLGLFRTRRIGSQLVNSVMMLLSTLFFFSAVKYVGVAEAISISFVAPLAVVFLAWPILGERITPMRVAAVVVGFVGVLVVIRPGSALFQWASVLLLGSAICYAIYQIIIRRLAGVDHPATSIFYSVLLGAILLSALARLAAAVLIGGAGRARPLLRGAGDDLCIGQFRGALQLHPDDRIGHRGLPHVRRGARPLHLARNRLDRGRGPAGRMAGRASATLRILGRMECRISSLPICRPCRPASAFAPCWAGPASCNCRAPITAWRRCRPGRQASTLCISPARP